MNLEQIKNHPDSIKPYLNRMVLTKDNGDFLGLCPFHDEKTASFRVNNKTGKWLFHCFGCSASGSVIDFVSKKDSISIGQAGKKIESEINNQSWDKSKELVQNSFAPIFKGVKEKLTLTMKQYYPLEQALANNKEAREWLLKERGITYENAKSLHLGFRSDLGEIAGKPYDDIRNKGWIAFPIFDGKDVPSIIGIKYRSIARKVFLHQPGMSSGLFNMRTIDPLQTLFVTEGEFDTVTLEQAGFRAISLPSASTKLTPEQKDEIMAASQIILAGDADQPGQDLMQRLWADFQEKTYLLQWPGGWKDANEVFKEMCGFNVESFRKIVNESLLKAKINPMPHIYSIAESMSSGNRTNLSDHPQRSRFPWPSVDKMAILLPGSVMSVSATNALAHDTLVITPTGKVKITDIKSGDKIIGLDGKPIKVLNVFPKEKRKIYRVNFSDGSFVRCDREHLWLVKNRYNKEYEILETQDIKKKNLINGKNYTFYIPQPEPVEFENKILPLSGYVLGALLGDGSFSKCVRFACSQDLQIVKRLSKELPHNHVAVPQKDGLHWYIRNKKKYSENLILSIIKNVGLFNTKSHNKFIPEGYLTAPLKTRVCLLQGLMDTDGSVSKTGVLSFYSKSLSLIQGFITLVRSLGGLINWVPGNKLVYFSLPKNINPFSVSRKQKIYESKSNLKIEHRNICEIKEDGFGFVTCLEVDAKDGLFLVNDYIPTHNTKMGKTAWVLNKTVEDVLRYDEIVLNYQCELSIDEISNMMAAYLLKKNRNGLSREDYQQAAKMMVGMPYYVGRNPSLNTVTPVLDLIEAGIRRLGATVVVLDHLHFICRNEQNEVQAQANAFQRIKNMAVKYGVKFIVVGQPRKANSASKGKVIHITDLKGSESFGSDADAIFVIHRDNILVKDPNDPPKDDYSPQTEVHLLGARSKGDGGTFAVLKFVGEWATFFEETNQVPDEGMLNF